MELYSHVLKVVVSVEEGLEEDRSEEVKSDKCQCPEKLLVTGLGSSANSSTFSICRAWGGTVSTDIRLPS